MLHPIVERIMRTGYSIEGKLVERENVFTVTTMCGCNKRIGKHVYSKQFLCTPCAIEGGFINVLDYKY